MQRKLLSFSLIIFTFLLSLNSEKVLASHAAGGFLTYEWLGGDTYRFTVTFYRDCAGVPEPNQIEIDFNSSCYPFSIYGLNVLAPKLAPTGGTEIGYACSGATTCSGGVNPGYKKYVYQVDVDMSLGDYYCSDWVISFQDPNFNSVLGRNGSITTIVNPGSEILFTETTLDNVNYPTNSSVTFDNDPVAFMCAGQPALFNLGGTDPDGDSLHYELTTALSYTTVTYNFPLSYLNPLYPGAGAVALDANTGEITINTSTQQIGVIDVLVTEYQNGAQVGSVMIDMQVIISACPANNYPTLTGINGASVFTDSICAGGNVNFTVNSNDIDAGQTVTMSWNNGIPSPATFSSSGSPPTGTFSWTTSAADARPQPYSFTVTVQDNACPSHGFQTEVYSIYVISGLNTITVNPSSSSICNGQSTTLIASGGISYSWSPGGATTSSISVSPAGATTYTVTGGGSCPGTATSNISVGSVSASSSAAPATICSGQSTTITAFGGGTYSWSPGGATTSSIAVSPSGNLTYTVTVTGGGGCTDTATTAVIVNTIPPAPTITKSATGDTLFSSIDVSYASYQWYRNAVLLSGQTNYYLVIIPTDTSTFSVTVQTSNNCTNSNLFSNRTLPIELLSFDVAYNGKTVDVFWSTASEINNDYFTVERTKDGFGFSPLAYVNGADNSSSLLNYHTVDENPLFGISAYRLKQTDFDGKYTYSRLVAVNIKSSGKLNIIALNKDQEQNLIRFFVYSPSDQPLTIEITDRIGRVMVREASAERDGAIDFSGFAHGIYLFRVFDNSESVIKKFIF